MKISTSTYWVLVADSGNARIFELRRKPAEFREVHTLVSDALHKRSKDLVSDGSGRSFHAQGPASHPKKQKSDPHERAEQEFSRKLVDKLELATNMNAFEKLVVFADPKTLGRMRPQMSKNLKGRVADELNLDLVGMPLEPMKKKIRAHLGWAT